MTEATRRRLLFGGICFCCLPLSRKAGAAQPVDVSEVAPGLHVRRGPIADASRDNAGGIANIGFIVGREAVAVIDPGGSIDDGEGLRLAIHKVTDRPIKYVILSHVHPDHIFGASAFQDDKPSFVGHARLPDLLAVRGEFYRKGLETILGAGHAGPVVMPTTLVAETTEIDLGARKLTLSPHKPAHTPSDLSVTDTQTGIVLTGDLLFVDRLPALDGDIKGWLAQLSAWRASGVAQAMPGHGPALVQYPAAARALERYLTVLLDDTRAAIKRGEPIEDAVTTVGQSERDNWQLFDAYHGRNVIEAYKKLEWE